MAYKCFYNKKYAGLLKCTLLVFLVYFNYNAFSFVFGKFSTFSKKPIKNGTFDVEKSLSPTVKDKLYPEVVKVQSKIRVESLVSHCGRPDPCPANRFSIHIYTGQDHKDQPKLCVDGKYILSKNSNGGGRGINLAVIDSFTREVSQVAHFDTYEKESTGLETLLLTLRPGDIIILLTFDEPTRKLTRITRLLLHELGSALIQNLFYRGSWYMVSQKGINGFSPYEELHYGEGGGWSHVHNARFCVPFKIEGIPFHPDPLPRINPARSQFCMLHSQFTYFCEANVMNDPLVAAPAPKTLVSSTRLFNTPILVLSKEYITFLPLTLETIIRQPGVNPSMVVVYYQNHSKTINKMADLFGFMSEELSGTNNTCEQIAEMFETAYLLFPDAKEVILVSDQVILAPDFFSYISQLLGLLDTDPSIQTISAWNENGFINSSGDPTLVYRVDTFSGVVTLFRKHFFQREWCKNWVLGDTYLLQLNVEGATSLVADLSRAMLVPTDSESPYEKVVRGPTRLSSLEINSILLRDAHLLHKSHYPNYLVQLMQEAVKVHLTDEQVNGCNPDEDLLAQYLTQRNVTGRNFVVFYPQSQADDLSSLKQLTYCWHLWHFKSCPPRPLFNANILRFTWRGSKVVMVGEKAMLLSSKM